MRLIDAKKLTQKPYDLELTYFLDNNVPPYAILSHRWGDEEVTFRELDDPNTFIKEQTHTKEGWRKIKHAARIAMNYRCEWLWCDTGCIDKTSSAELSESINSMFQWYRDSALCIAYLGDYPLKVNIFTDSEWFDRAWTFQELVAPPKLVFFDCRWNTLFGRHDNATKQALAEEIVHKTEIDIRILHDPSQLSRVSIAQRMSWAAGRRATKIEDIAYSLLGIFDVNMPMLYGEGDKAFIRLQEEIMKRSPDQSVLVWTSASTRTLLASAPSDYRPGFKMDPSTRKSFALNNLGLEIELSLRMVGFNTYVAPLGVEGPEGPGYFAHLLLEIDGEGGELCRVGSMSMATFQDDFLALTQKTRPVTILRTHLHREKPSMNSLYGFRLAADCLPLTVVNKWDPQHRWDRGIWGRWDLSNVSKVPPVEQVKQRAYRRPTWDEQGMGDLFHHELSGARPSFVYSEDSSATIAMMTLVLDENHKLLIQLSFDFDFNPCCHISRLTYDFGERFREHNWTTPAEDKRFLWPFTEHSWTDNIRSRSAMVEDLSTGKRAWVAKSMKRQKFVEQVPSTITHPYKLEVRFDYHDNISREWVFSVISPNQDLHEIQKYVGDQFAVRDVQAGTQDRTPQDMMTDA